MAGAARQARHAHPAGRDRCREPVAQPRVRGGRGRARAHLPAELDAAPGGDRRGLGVHVAAGPLAHAVVLVADVQAEAHRAGHDVARPRPHRELSDRGDDAGGRARRRLHGQDQLGGGAQGVAPVLHRDGPGVPGRTHEPDRDPALPRDGGDDPDRQVEPLEHGPLLDVDLDVADRVLRRPAADPPGQRLRVAAVRPHGFGEGHALLVLAPQQLRVEAIGVGGAAEVGGAVAQPLLVGEADHLDRERRAVRARVQPGDAGQRDQDAERAVVAARVADRVEVGAEHQRPRPRARVAADQVADRVAADLHARGAHPLGHERGGPPHRGRAEGADEQARLLADRPELVGAAQHRGRIAHRQLPR